MGQSGKEHETLVSVLQAGIASCMHRSCINCLDNYKSNGMSVNQVKEGPN